MYVSSASLADYLPGYERALVTPGISWRRFRDVSRFVETGQAVPAKKW
jgi:hypothetical protein